MAGGRMRAVADRKIRPATQNDLMAVAQVHIRSYCSAYQGIIPQVYLEAMSCEQQCQNWERRLFHQDSREFMWVAEDDSENIAGFIVASLCRTHERFEREVSAVYICRKF